MNHNRDTKLHSRPRRLVSLGAGALATVTALLGPAGGAHADTFNPWPDSGVVTTSYFGNCSITRGSVQDPFGNSSSYAIIGGARIACSSRHNLRVQVLEYYASPGGYYAPVAWSANTEFRNSYGFSPNILETARYCGPGVALYGWWYTRVYAYEFDPGTGKAIYGGYFDSNARLGTAKSHDQYGRC